MLMHDRAYHMIFYALDYRSIFSAVEAVVHTLQNAVRRVSASIHTVPNVLGSGSFLNVLKQLTHQLVMFFQVLPASEIGLLRVFPPNLCLQIFSVRQNVLYPQV